MIDALAHVRGRVEVSTELGRGSEFRIIVPITLTIVPCLITQVSGQAFAVPMAAVVRVLKSDTSTSPAGGRSHALVDGRGLALTDLSEVLGLPDGMAGPSVVLGTTGSTHAFRVEALVGQRDVVVRGLDGLIPRAECVAGASVEPDGSILFVLDVPALLQRARASRGAEAGTASSAATTLTAAVTPGAPAPAAVAARASLLVVDDALTVRELQRSILERAGYEVRTANDGREALALLAERPADLVLTDLEMPNLDGFGLTAAIRSQPRLANIPVLMVTSRSSDEDRRRGLGGGRRRLHRQERVRRRPPAERGFRPPWQARMKAVSAVLLCPGDRLRRDFSTSLAREGEVLFLQSADPREAVEVVSRLTPEVVVLVFDGSASALTAIQDIMARQPTPILLVTAEGVSADAAALGVESGAVDVAAAPAGRRQAQAWPPSAAGSAGSAWFP